MTTPDYTPQQLQAYNALRIAAERIGYNGYMAAVAEYRKKHPGASLSTITSYQTRRGRSIYTPTGEHVTVIETMPKVLTGEVSPEEAMALLWQYDVMKQRTGR